MTGVSGNIKQMYWVYGTILVKGKAEKSGIESCNKFESEGKR